MFYGHTLSVAICWLVFLAQHKMSEDDHESGENGGKLLLLLLLYVCGVCTHELEHNYNK